jgi:hypothetical protein
MFVILNFISSSVATSATETRDMMLVCQPDDSHKQEPQLICRCLCNQVALPMGCAYLLAQLIRRYVLIGSASDGLGGGA